MSHEPECFGTQNIHYSSSDCPICSILRAAYKRGREDAGFAVSRVALQALYAGDSFYGDTPNALADAAEGNWDEVREWEANLIALGRRRGEPNWYPERREVFNNIPGDVYYIGDGEQE